MSDQIQGNTITLRREFVDFSGGAYDPTNATLKLYDTQKQQIGETVTVGAEHKVATGVYEIEVTLPMGYDMIVYEFAGTDLRGRRTWRGRRLRRRGRRRGTAGKKGTARSGPGIHQFSGFVLTGSEARKL